MAVLNLPIYLKKLRNEFRPYVHRIITKPLSDFETNYRKSKSAVIKLRPRRALNFLTFSYDGKPIISMLPSSHEQHNLFRNASVLETPEIDTWVEFDDYWIGPGLFPFQIYSKHRHSCLNNIGDYENLEVALSRVHWRSEFATTETRVVSVRRELLPASYNILGKLIVENFQPDVDGSCPSVNVELAPFLRTKRDFDLFLAEMKTVIYPTLPYETLYGVPFDERSNSATRLYGKFDQLIGSGQIERSVRSLLPNIALASHELNAIYGSYFSSGFCTLDTTIAPLLEEQMVYHLLYIHQFANPRTLELFGLGDPTLTLFDASSRFSNVRLGSERAAIFYFLSRAYLDDLSIFLNWSFHRQYISLDSDLETWVKHFFPFGIFRYSLYRDFFTKDVPYGYSFREKEDECELDSLGRTPAKFLGDMEYCFWNLIDYGNCHTHLRMELQKEFSVSGYVVGFKEKNLRLDFDKDAFGHVLHGSKTIYPIDSGFFRPCYSSAIQNEYFNLKMNLVNNVGNSDDSNYSNLVNLVDRLGIKAVSITTPKLSQFQDLFLSMHMGRPTIFLENYVRLLHDLQLVTFYKHLLQIYRIRFNCEPVPVDLLLQTYPELFVYENEMKQRSTKNLYDISSW